MFFSDVYAKMLPL